jgi:hypothetical protein
VLASLGTAASNLRKKLGESLSSIQKYDAKIEQATTSSLEALKAYAMGDEERTRGRSRESLVFYKRATELDPNFAMAYARIGVHYFNQGQVETTKTYIQKAYDLRDRVSERERLYIARKYYNYVPAKSTSRRDTANVVEALSQDFVPAQQSFDQLQAPRPLRRRAEEALEASRLSPNNTSARTNVISNFLSLGGWTKRSKHLPSAEDQSRSVNRARHAAFLAFIRGDQAAIDREIEWAKGKPEELTSLRRAPRTRCTSAS